MLRAINLSLSIVGIVGIIGCGGSGSGGGAGSGGGGGNAAGGNAAGGTTGGGGTSGGGTSGGGSGGMLAACGTDTSAGSGDTCNTAVADGPCVMAQVSAGAAPTPAGGTIGAGTYRLTSETFYGATDAGNQQEDRRETFVISSVTVAGFTLDQNRTSGTRVDRAHGTVVVTGTTVTFTPTCPPPGTGDNGGSAQFTATATTFSLIQSKNGGTEVSVYTKS